MLKKLYFLSFFAFAFALINAQRPLIFKYFVSNSEDTTIRINTVGDYSYTFKKSNDQLVTGSGFGISGLTEISVPETGTYTISLIPSGTFKFKGSNPPSSFIKDVDKFTEIIQWGDIQWNTDLSYMFYNYTNLQITATDIPDFSNVISMSRMFGNCINLSIVNNINKWNVENVRDMNHMFVTTDLFNQDISNWNVSNVTNMSGMFYSAKAFNRDVGKWNVANVTDMSYMFSNAKNFNQDISRWNVANVTDMNNMFEGAEIFNSNIGLWDVSKVENMSVMFARATSFNKNINNWDVSKVTNMFAMFHRAYAFNQKLSNWNVTNVKNMQMMFNFAITFNQNINNWNVAKVGNMNGMFQDAWEYNQEMTTWNVATVSDMNGMFESALAFNQNLGEWDLSPVVKLNNLFNNAGLNCDNFGATLKGWAENPNTPYVRTIGAINLTIGTIGKHYSDVLVNDKGWTFIGYYYNPNCDEIFLKVENLSGNKNTISLYPNPATEVVFIKSVQKTKNVQVFDTIGKVVLNVTGSTEINVQNLSSGLYVLKVTMVDGSVSTHKLIKK